MTIHTVQQGEYLSSIAAQYNQPRWQSIYFHAANAEFRQKRPNPNVIRPGDRIVIPDPATKEELCVTGRTHKFRVHGEKLLLRVVVRDCDGQVLANEPYVLKAGERQYRGTTNGRGLLEREIQVGATTGFLSLERRNLELPIAIGHLDPIDDGDDSFWTGVQARLKNLGFYGGSIDNDRGPITAQAIKSFQQNVLGRAEPDGELDSETRAALLSEHGC